MLRIATRGSALARWQAEHVASLLGGAELVIVETAGDRDQSSSLSELGGRGVFVKEVQAAVLDGRADLAVHSAKDLPSVTVPGLLIAAVPERGDPRDALVGSTLDDLPQGAEVATGSLRRQAQLAAGRPDLRFVGLRGNMATRLRKAVDHDAIVVAATALDRLGLADRIAERLPTDLMLPQVAQAALAVECRDDDTRLQDLLRSIEHAGSRQCVDAERSFLAALGGDCSLPAAAFATISDGTLSIEGRIAAVDGSVVLRHVGTDGAAVAHHLLDEQGGAALLNRA